MDGLVSGGESRGAHRHGFAVAVAESHHGAAEPPSHKVAVFNLGANLKAQLWCSVILPPVEHGWRNICADRDGAEWLLARLKAFSIAWSDSICLLAALDRRDVGRVAICAAQWGPAGAHVAAPRAHKACEFRTKGLRGDLG